MPQQHAKSGRFLSEEMYSDFTLEMARKVPAEPVPSMAILMTIKAKWYQRYIEKSLVRDTSNIMTEHETRKMAAYERFILVIISSLISPEYTYQGHKMGRYRD